MIYTMAELEALTGLTARTIRDYIRHGYLAPPASRGPNATYDEEQMLRVVTIARMRAQGKRWDEVADRLKSSSLAKLRAFVRQTEPKQPSPPTPPPSEGSAGFPALEGEPVVPGLPPRHPEAGTTTELDVLGKGPDGASSDGTRLVMAPVLPGLVLLVNEDAAPLVKRVAAEILAKYRVWR
jgi:DNA-binding transcriptional MerR regulator